jgi:hypothetical protein
MGAQAVVLAAHDTGLIKAVESALVNGPRANGFPTEMWTPARAAEVIEQVTGVRYPPTQT